MDAKNKMKNILTKTYRHFMHDSMHRNSTFLILSQAVLAVSGFLFWIINAHLFTAEAVGLATSFISFGALAASFTNLGLPNTIIRFLPTSKRRGGLFTASLMLVLGASIAGGIIAIQLAKYAAPKLAYIHSSTVLSVLLVTLVVSTSLGALLDGTFVAFRRGEYLLKKALLINIPRVILPFFVVMAGVRGMASVYVVTLVLGIVYNLTVIFWRLLKNDELLPTLTEVSKHRPYAVSNYFGGLFGVLPGTLTPIIILSALGSSSAAYFYMPLMIASFLSLVSGSVSQALIAECSQTEDVAQHRIFFWRAFKHQYQLLIPIVFTLLVLGWPILRVYGASYASNGYLPVVILLGSSLIAGLNWLGDTWLNIQKRSRDYFLMNAFNALAVVALVYLFAAHGLIAASLGWLCGQLLSALVYLVIFGRAQLLSSLYSRN